MKLDLQNMTTAQIEEEMEKISAQIDELYDLNSDCSKELRRRDDEKVQMTNDCLKLSNDTHIIAIAKHLDYHLSLVQVFTNLRVGKNDVEYLLHNYRIDDYEYSYRVSKQSQYKSVFHNMIEEYDLYATDSPSTVADILKKFSVLGIKADDYKNAVRDILVGSIIGKITTSKNQLT